MPEVHSTGSHAAPDRFTVEPRELARARRKFCRHRSLEEFCRYLRLFRSLGSFADIARELEVTRAAVSLVYLRYFRLVFPDFTSGRSRLELARSSKPAPVLAGPAKIVADKARRQGLRVCGVPKKDGWNQTHLFIEGNLCRLHHRRGLQSPDKGLDYSNFWFSLDATPTANFHILIQEVDGKRRFFVVPRAALVERYGSAHGTVSIYAPMRERRVRGKIRPLFEVMQYLERWDLLRPLEAEGGENT